MQTCTEQVLRYPDGGLRVQGPQQVFGELVRRAAPHIEHYHSDLYHDAQWLERYWDDFEDGGAFFFAVRKSGTQIGCDYALTIASHRAAGMRMEAAYRVCLIKTAHEDTKRLIVEELTGENN